MKANQIRQKFFDFFESKGHKIVASAPIVIKNDPTLMFTNAGMNQFKDFFLGNAKPDNRRIADTQKCLRVSGKHNDLEEVGIDSYHHTMFEMLGNWSIGDYFKEEAIAWAWELLTEEYKLPKDRLYVTIFEGDEKENLELDSEASDYWSKWIPKERIIPFDKKDNFWEMGDTGPCGPCSEIHVDLRPDEERAKIDGKTLVNMDHPQVVEIWNLVFIQYNRKADGSLENLPEKHIDTGMGFERLCMAMQAKTSNYDTDVFSPFIALIEEKTGVKYNGSYDLSAKSDIAMRVIVDHIRAVAFALADGEMPSNTGAGYVIRRILRRAVRYYFSFLDRKEPLLHELIGLLANRFAEVFPELKAQEAFVINVIHEEEKSFLRTLDAGLKRMDQLDIQGDTIPGPVAFELYDTYGFPIDLTRLIAGERSLKVDNDGFEESLEAQRNRGRAATQRSTGDWTVLDDTAEVDFVGYDQHQVHGTRVIKYRTVEEKKKKIYQIVLAKTPFYAEGGGQVGDTGFLDFEGEKVKVLTTKRENDLFIHYVNKFPSDLKKSVNATIDKEQRALIENNHSATHLMHSALREVLGDHVQQRGSLVRDSYLRFDFSHFAKLSSEEIAKVEQRVNQKIRENIKLQEDRAIPIAEAQEKGATMLFGEKYGDVVRMITFDPSYSKELCGGCHVEATGEIGIFKIKSESAVAAGVRRIEALTSVGAEQYINAKLAQLSEVEQLFKSPQPAEIQVSKLLEENKKLLKEIEKLQSGQANALKGKLIAGVQKINNKNLIAEKIDLTDSKAAKTLAYNIEKELGDAVILFAIENGPKVQLMLAISESLVEQAGMHAGNIIRDISKHINGGGGGQAFFATAGGSNPEGIQEALKAIKNHL